MSDDGRTFFATREALVPQDTDGIIDVYEFVGGRPQLISTGTGTRDFGASGLVQIFFVPEHIGLEAVSHDGTDVFFTTYDSLVNRTRTATSSSSMTQGPTAGSSRHRHWRRVQRPTSVMGRGAVPKAPRNSRPGPTSAPAATCEATQPRSKEFKEEAKAPSQEARAPDEASPWLSDGRTRRGRWPPHSARRGCSSPSARRRSPQQPDCSCWLPGSRRRKQGSPNGPHRSRLPRPGGIRISIS